MKLNKVLLGLILAASTHLVLAVEPAPVFDVNSKPNAIIEQLTSLSNKLEARNRGQVIIQQQLDELQNEVNDLRGVTELHTHQLNQVLERQRELYQELDRRVTEALKPSSTAAVALVSQNSDNQVNYSNDLTENEAYDRAVNLVLKDKLYEQAITEFRKFNQKYPQSTYAANAHYWLGQLLFNKGEFNQATAEFSLVSTQYKDSPKRPDALLKLGMVAQKQDKNSQALTLYRQLVTEYPNSTAGQLAKARITSLSQ